METGIFRAVAKGTGLVRPGGHMRAMIRVALLIVVVAVSAAPAAAGTAGWQAPTPTGNTFHAAYTPDGVTHYLVGDGGMIARYGPAGPTFMDSPTECPLYGVHGTSATDIWAVGGCDGVDSADPHRATVLHYNGTSWQSVTPPNFSGVYYVLKDVWAADADTAYAILEIGTAVARYDGAGWSTFVPPLGQPVYQSYSAVHGFAENDVYIVGSCGQIIHYNGSGWTLMRQEEGASDSFCAQLFDDVWGPSADKVYACGNWGMFYGLREGQWDKLNPHEGELSQGELLAMSGTSERIYLSSTGGLIMKYDTTFGQALNTGLGSNLNFLSPRAGGYLVGGDWGYLGLFNGQALTNVSTPAGRTTDWAYAGRGRVAWLCPSEFLTGQDLVTYDGRSYVVRTPAYEDWWTVTGFRLLSDTDVWLGARGAGLSSEIRRYTGSAWTEVSFAGASGYLLDVARTGSGALAVVIGSAWIDDGYGYAGEACLETPSGLTCAAGGSVYKKLATASDGAVYAAGTQGRIAVLRDGAWTLETAGDKDLTAIAAGGGYICAAGRDRSAWLRTNAGAFARVTGITEKTGATFTSMAHVGSGNFVAALTTGRGEYWSIQAGAGARVLAETTPIWRAVAADAQGNWTMAGSHGSLYGLALTPVGGAGAPLELLLLDE